MPDYVRGIDVERRPWQRRIEVYSPKLGRRVTYFSRTAYEAWLLLESDPTIKTFCERPAYLEDQAGRLIDFWVSRGRQASFWQLATDKAEHVTWPARVHGLPLRIIPREEMVAHSTRMRIGHVSCPTSRLTRATWIGVFSATYWADYSNRIDSNG